MMKLIIDAGNTAVKVAVCKGSEIVIKKKYSAFTPQDFNFLLKEFPIKALACSSVGAFDIESLEAPIDIKKINLNAALDLPIANRYESKDTLGMDRLAGVLGMYYLNPNKNNLLIDAGTCITFDFLNAKNEYLGGSIHPGMTMRFKALNTFTAKLPLVERKNADLNLIGNTTESSILTGVLKGLEMEINGMISEYEKSYGNISIYLCGGDADYLKKTIKYPTFVEKDILLTGLNNLLDSLLNENA